MATEIPAFHPSVRREIGERDNWECVECGRRGKDGWHLQAAHYPELHQEHEDDNPENGRLLCTTCHIIEEIQRGNEYGAKQLWLNQTIRNYQWLDNFGVPDEKEPFEWYRERAEQLMYIEDELTILGIES